MFRFLVFFAFMTELPRQTSRPSCLPLHCNPFKHIITSFVVSVNSSLLQNGCPFPLCSLHLSHCVVSDIHVSLLIVQLCCAFIHLSTFFLTLKQFILSAHLCVEIAK